MYSLLDTLFPYSRIGKQNIPGAPLCKLSTTFWESHTVRCHLFIDFYLSSISEILSKNSDIVLFWYTLTIPNKYGFEYVCLSSLIDFMDSLWLIYVLTSSITYISKGQNIEDLVKIERTLSGLNVKITFKGFRFCQKLKVSKWNNNSFSFKKNIMYCNLMRWAKISCFKKFNNRFYVTVYGPS